MRMLIRTIDSHYFTMTSMYDVVYDTNQYQLLEFDTEAELLEYAAQHNLIAPEIYEPEEIDPTIQPEEPPYA